MTGRLPGTSPQQQQPRPQQQQQQPQAGHNNNNNNNVQLNIPGLGNINVPAGAGLNININNNNNNNNNNVVRATLVQAAEANIFTIPPMWKRIVAELLDFMILFVLKVFRIRKRESSLMNESLLTTCLRLKLDHLPTSCLLRHSSQNFSF